MNSTLKNFLNDYISLVDTESYEELYEKAQWYLQAAPDMIGQLTKILMDCGARPLNKLTTVPSYYFCGLNKGIVNIPDHIQGFEDNAFEYATINILKLPHNLQQLKDDAFENSNIALVQLTGGVEWFCNIPVESWQGIWGCNTQLLDENGNHIRTLTIPSTVTTVPSQHFEDLSGFETVELQEGVHTISKGAFSGCGNLCTVYMPNSLRVIETDAFAFCSNLTRIVYNGHFADFTYMIRKADNNAWLQDPSEAQREVCIECTDGDYSSITWEQY